MDKVLLIASAAVIDLRDTWAKRQINLYLSYIDLTNETNFYLSSLHGNWLDKT
jgi:hypothetical protein